MSYHFYAITNERNSRYNSLTFSSLLQMLSWTLHQHPVHNPRTPTTWFLPLQCHHSQHGNHILCHSYLLLTTQRWWTDQSCGGIFPFPQFSVLDGGRQYPRQFRCITTHHKLSNCLYDTHIIGFVLQLCLYEYERQQTCTEMASHIGLYLYRSICWPL